MRRSLGAANADIEAMDKEIATLRARIALLEAVVQRAEDVVQDARDRRPHPEGFFMLTASPVILLQVALLAVSSEGKVSP